MAGSRDEAWRTKEGPSLAAAFTDSRRFRILAIVDDFTRESLALIPDTSLSGARVARELDALIERRGRPRTCVSDNGTELTSMAILRVVRDERRGLTLHRTGQTAAERLRGELHRPAARRVPERNPIRIVSQARSVLEAWRTDYNGVRPHSALANKTPEEFRAQHIAVAASAGNGQNFRHSIEGNTQVLVRTN